MSEVWFPERQYTDTDLRWIVKIPDLENVIMDTSNAIDQTMPFKESIVT